MGLLREGIGLRAMAQRDPAGRVPGEGTTVQLHDDGTRRVVGKTCSTCSSRSRRTGCRGVGRGAQLAFGREQCLVSPRGECRRGDAPPPPQPTAQAPAPAGPARHARPPARGAGAGGPGRPSPQAGAVVSRRPAGWPGRRPAVRRASGQRPAGRRPASWRAVPGPARGDGRGTPRRRAAVRRRRAAAVPSGRAATGRWGGGNRPIGEHRRSRRYPTGL